MFVLSLASMYPSVHVLVVPASSLLSYLIFSLLISHVGYENTGRVVVNLFIEIQRRRTES